MFLPLYYSMPTATAPSSTTAKSTSGSTISGIKNSTTGKQSNNNQVQLNMSDVKLKKVTVDNSITASNGGSASGNTSALGLNLKSGMRNNMVVKPATTSASKKRRPVNKNSSSLQLSKTKTTIDEVKVKNVVNASGGSKANGNANIINISVTNGGGNTMVVH